MAFDMTGTRRMDTHGFARLIAPSIALAAALAAFAPQIAPAGEGAAPNSYVVAPGETRKSLQLGVGRSVIVDLPQDATEIFVGDPKVANAVVRSARRLYVAAVANGQTTIFALAADGSKIAAIEVTVGRDIGELQELLNVALPGNEITVKTVADSIILMGSVASAGEAQKALDIASGFVGTSVLGGAANAPQTAPATGAAGTSMQVSVAPSGTPLTGKVINSLTIRGLDQISLRVTISEIRRDIVKQLGVNMSGVGSGSNGFVTSNPFTVNGVASATEATLGWVTARHEPLGDAAGVRAPGRRAHARRADGDRRLRRSRPSSSPAARSRFPTAKRAAPANRLRVELHSAALRRDAELHAGRAVAEPHPAARRAPRSPTSTPRHQITIADTSIPGFRTRKNETTVELPSGGSIASAGLISDTVRSRRSTAFPA